MSTRKRKFLEKVIARISHGSVPVDGGYWLDAKAARFTAVPGTERGRIPSLGPHPLSRQRCA